MTTEEIKKYLQSHTVLSNSGTHVIWAEDIDKISKGLSEIQEKESLKVNIQTNRLLGEYKGSLEGVCLWDIPLELKKKLKTIIKTLRID